MIVGIDEAGRGPLAGCVVACALSLDKQPPFTPQDSKKLSSSAREKMYDWLQYNSLFSVAIATNQEIDKVNILEATFLAFSRAIEGLIQKAPNLKKANFIIDGNLFRTNLPIKYTCVEKADTKIKEVMCASIVAKVVRDHLMQVADFLYPEWEFNKHKGYPTSKHFSLIEKYPLTPLHRRSFWPCSL